MKLADAENLLALKKRQGPIKERWVTETEEGIVLECWPLGFARGSIGISDMFSVIPHAQYSALYAGSGRPHHLSVNHGPHRLWQQEAYVYYLEMRAAARKALENIDRAAHLPRIGEEPGKTSSITNDEAAHPEDFRLFWQPPLSFPDVEACLAFLKAQGDSKWQKENSSNTRSSITRNKRKTKRKETNGPSQLSSLIQKWSSLPVKPKLPCSPPAQLSWEIT